MNIRVKEITPGERPSDPPAMNPEAPGIFGEIASDCQKFVAEMMKKYGDNEDLWMLMVVFRADHKDWELRVSGPQKRRADAAAERDMDEP